MRPVPFFILTALSLIFAGLTVAETVMYQKWDKAVNEQKQMQAKTAFFQRLRLRVFTEQLMRRISVDAQHDPALAKMLKQNQIKTFLMPSDALKKIRAIPSPLGVPVDKPGEIPFDYYP